MRKLRDNLPLALMGMAFVSLAAATQCTASSGDPATNSEADANGPMNGEADASHLGTDDSGTPLGCAKDTDCPLPKSKCEDSSTLVYYSDAKCVQHQCQWQSQRLQGAYCNSGGFVSTTTAGGAPIITMSDGQAGLATIGDAAEDHPNIASPDAGSCAEDASSCAVPSSVCADQRWVAFFTNGSCHQNRCQWEVGYRDCGVAGCQAGGCILNVTAK